MTEGFALEKLNTARQALAEANTIPDVKLVLDQVSAIVNLTKSQRLSLECVNEASAFRLWTRRKLGELLAEMPKNNGTKGQLKGRDPSGGNILLPPENDMPTLTELGIGKMESSRLQSEACIPVPVVQEYIEESNAKEQEITTAGLQRKAKGLVSDKSTYDGDEWHTPVEYIESARELMGSIDLDPATCETAQESIQAAHYLTKEDDGLLHPWYGKVWLNPPYSMPKIEQFVDKLIAEFEQSNVIEAVILVNNSSDTKWFHRLLARFPACFTRGRVQFWHPEHQGFATRQGQTFFYLGPNWKSEIFQDVFGKFGVVVGKL